MNKKETLTKDVSLKFSFYSFICIFIVVLFHSDFRYFYPIIEDLTPVSTSYFFCVSAFFFYRGLNNDNITLRLKRRCKTLLLPYLIWNLIYMIPYIIFYKVPFSSIVRGFTINPFCTPSWYLLTLFLFFLLAPFVKHVLASKYLTLALLNAIVITSYLGYVKFQQELALVPFVGGYLIRMAEYITPFLLGAIIGTYFSNQIYVTWKNGVIGILCSGAIIFLLFYPIPPAMRWFLWVILPITLWKSIPEKIFNISTFTQYLTAPSFIINMAHCYLLGLYKPLLAQTKAFTEKRLTALTVLCAIITAYALYYLLKKVLPKTLNALTGSRI